MKLPNRFSYRLLWAAGVAALVAGCMSTREHEQEARVSAAELSAPARATLERVTAGGAVEKIDREKERGKMVYDVEATVEGKHLEFVIAEEDGAVLGTEVPVDMNQVPEPVRASATQYFGEGAELTAMKCVEYGETAYEIEGRKGGKKV